MDWLEDLLPFLRSIDGGDGAIELALVAFVCVLLVSIAVVVVARRRAPG